MSEQTKNNVFDIPFYPFHITQNTLKHVGYVYDDKWMWRQKYAGFLLNSHYIISGLLSYNEE